ncbi:MAG: hypothetical protein OHK0046_39370 [Anaerolineae bacterium]
MRKTVSFLCCLLFITVSVVAQSGTLRGRTNDLVNMRSGPGTGFDVIEILPYNANLTFIGRNQSSTWLLAEYAEVQGWVSYTFVEIQGRVESLPIVEASPVNNAAPPADVETTEEDTAPPAGNTTIRAVTNAIVNMRSGPGVSFSVIAVLPYDASLTVIGRNQSSTWLLVENSQGRGWLSYTYVDAQGRVNSLPVTNETVTPATTTTTRPAAPSDAPVVAAPSGVVPTISRTARRIFVRGQELGNHADVFSKVGDSITASDLFLDPIGTGGLQLHEYAYLQPVVDYFSQTPLRDHFSFANTSLAARSGWTAADLLNPGRAAAGLCMRDETPLACEYRVNMPSVALIMIGTNDASTVRSEVYEANVRRILEITIERGIIPVISTLPDQPNTRNADRVLEFNGIIRRLAGEYDIPLWDYWQALQPLPNQGMSSDNIHPSYDFATQATAIFTGDSLRYGYNMRNLTALMVLDAVWRGALS